MSKVNHIIFSQLDSGVSKIVLFYVCFKCGMRAGVDFRDELLD